MCLTAPARAFIQEVDDLGPQVLIRAHELGPISLQLLAEVFHLRVLRITVVEFTSKVFPEQALTSRVVAGLRGDIDSVDEMFRTILNLHWWLHRHANPGP